MNRFYGNEVFYNPVSGLIHWPCLWGERNRLSPNFKQIAHIHEKVRSNIYKRRQNISYKPPFWKKSLSNISHKPPFGKNLSQTFHISLHSRKNSYKLFVLLSIHAKYSPIQNIILQNFSWGAPNFSFSFPNIPEWLQIFCEALQNRREILIWFTSIPPLRPVKRKSSE